MNKNAIKVRVSPRRRDTPLSGASVLLGWFVYSFVLEKTGEYAQQD